MVRTYFIVCFLLWSYFGFTQLNGFQVKDGKIEIPFRFQNNFILVDVLFNDTYPLTFIFDTGSENTILLKKTYAELMGIKYLRDYKVYGADLQKELLVHLANGVDLDLSKISANNSPILILDEDYFRFEKYTGLKIHGILGMDLFKLTVIQINYKKRKIILHAPEDFKAPSNKFISFPVEMFHNKYYLSTKGTIQNNEPVDLTLLLDTGANISLLLHNKSDSTISLPAKLIPGKLGDGLGGFIEGYMGRTQSLSIGDFTFSSIITNFQELPPDLNPNTINNRNGILGNGLLSRFNIIFAPFFNTIYLKPEKHYNRGFKFDRSGIVMVASGLNLDRYTVLDVIPNSPAAKAGVQKGDQIIRVNGLSTKFSSMEGITRKFQKRVGKKFKIVVLRDGHKKRFSFRLEELI